MPVIVHGSLVPSLDRGIIQLPGMMRLAAMQGARDLAEAIRRYTPIKTGALRASIHPRRVRAVPLSRMWIIPVESSLDYASYIEDGTRPHLIFPHNPEGVLVFTPSRAGYFGRGLKVHTKWVRHPGNRPFRMFALGCAEVDRTTGSMLERRLRTWTITTRQMP